MNINSNFQLALRIAGTKQRRAGFAPLVTVGVLAGDEGANMYRSTMVAERPAYVVKHAETYILYQLIDRGAKPFDADANGVLSIALTISRNAQLAEGKSPFTLLDEVYKKFVETYMESTSDGRLSFIDADCDNDIFREIVSLYKLEPRKSSYVTMAQQGLTGVVCVPQDKLADFFANTQYKEFAQFKDVEIGVSCVAQVTQGLENLQIPLSENVYDIWVNGKPVGVSMQSPSDRYTATAESTSLYYYESVDFTLSELLSAPMNEVKKNGATISLDHQENRIICKLKKTEIHYDLIYEWDDRVGGGARKQILSFVKSGDLRLKFGTIDLSRTLLEQYSGLCYVKATDIKGEKIEFKPQTIDSYSLKTFHNIDNKKHQIITKIIINKKAISGESYIIHSQQPARVQSPTSTSKISDYSEGGDQPHIVQDAQKDEKWFNIKSFLLGILVGAIVVLGIWLTVSHFSKSKNTTNTIVEKRKDTLEVVDIDTLPKRSPQENVQTEADSGIESAETDDPEADPGEEKEDEQKIRRREEAAKAAENKAELIKFVSTKPTLNEYRKHPGFSVLTQDEKISIESFLNPDQYEKSLNPNAFRNLKKKIQESDYSFKTMDDVREVQKKIGDFLKDPNNQK